MKYIGLIVDYPAVNRFWYDKARHEDKQSKAREVA